MTTSALARGIKSIIVSLINLLPGSPFVYLEQTGGIYKFMRWFNWIIPVDWIITTLSAWLICAYVYQVWQVGLRWFRVIQ